MAWARLKPLGTFSTRLGRTGAGLSPNYGPVPSPLTIIAPKSHTIRTRPQSSFPFATAATRTSGTMTASSPPSPPAAPTSNKKPINLLRGWPSPSLLPVPALSESFQEALSDPAVYEPGLQYGPDPGYQPLREALASWLSEFYTFTPTTSTALSPPAGDKSIDRGSDVGAWPQGADKMARYTHPADVARICITGGASQSIAALLQGFTDPDPAATRAIWMAAPCYFLACPIFADAGFAPRDRRLRAVPEDDEGLDIAFLEHNMRALDREAEREYGKRPGLGDHEPARRGWKDPSPRRKIYRHIIYCAPSFSNPTGKTMSLARREGLVRLAREFDALVICDDVYDHLQWPAADDADSVSQLAKAVTTASPASEAASEAASPARLRRALLPRLLDIDLSLGPSVHDPPTQTFGHVVSNGSFSKVCAPGVRTGWTESWPAFAAGVAATGSSVSGGAPSQATATAVHRLLASGRLDHHIRHVLRPAYQHRHALLLSAVRRLIVPLGGRIREGGSLPSYNHHSPLSSDDAEAEALRVYGGFFLWITFAETAKMSGQDARVPPARTIAARCLAEEELMVGTGHLFEVHGDEAAVRLEREIRLCFAWEDEPDLVEGVERLARVLRRMIDEGESGWGAEEADGDVGEMK